MTDGQPLLAVVGGVMLSLVASWAIAPESLRLWVEVLGIVLGGRT